MKQRTSFFIFIFFLSVFSSSFILTSPWPPTSPKTTIMHIPTLMQIPTNTFAPSPTVIVKKIIKPTPTSTITPTPKPPNISSTTHGQIFAAINSYRQEHGLLQISQNTTLCSIAQTRAKQQSESGHLNHDGFDAIAHSQTEFHHIAEILQWFPEQKDATYLVYTGWDGSAPHRSVMLDSSWTHGCAGVSGYYSVFIFARE